MTAISGPDQNALLAHQRQRLSENLMRTTATALLLAALAVIAGPGTAHAAHAARSEVVVVDVVDRTAGAWPVAAAAEAWGESPVLDVRMSDRCFRGTYCVRVVQGSYDPAWLGGAQPINHRTAVVMLNTSPDVAHWTVDPVVRSGVVCHELAHAFGVNHPAPSTGQWGCIANSDFAHTTALPSFRDRRLLAAAARDPFGSQWGAFRYYADRVAGY